MAKLIVNPSSPSRREVSLSRAQVSIGRDPANDVVLPDAMVSRRHAVIEHRGSEYFLKDCNSSNGSLVNGDRVNERSLKDGDVLALGSVRLIFREDLRSEPGAKIVQHPSAPRLQCPSCQAGYVPGDLYCRQCGAGLVIGPSRTVCVACGTTVRLPAQFCTACGRRIGFREEGGARAESEAQSIESSAGEPRHLLRRTAAGVLDAVIVVLGQSILLSPALLYWNSRDSGSDVRFVPILLTLCLGPLALVLASLYYVFCWGLRGATPGKFLFGLVVQGEDGEEPIGMARALLRFVGYLASAASAGIGFVLIAFEGRGLHDYVAGTRVIRRKRS